MLRIAHLANVEEQLPPKKSAKEQKIERVMLMIKNERVKDRKKAEALFAADLIAVEKELQQLNEEILKLK